jgi:hypothetical protein
VPSWAWNSLETWLGGTGGPYSGTLKYVPAAAVVFVFLTGVAVTLWHRSIVECALLVGPIGLVAVAAVLHVYPFRGRAILFLIPLALILLVRAAEALGRALGESYARLAPLALIPVAVAALVASDLPQDPQQMRVIEARPVCEPAADGRTSVASATRVSWRAHRRIARTCILPTTT